MMTFVRRRRNRVSRVRARRHTEPAALVRLLTPFNYADEPVGRLLAITLMMTWVNTRSFPSLYLTHPPFTRTPHIPLHPTSIFLILHKLIVLAIKGLSAVTPLTKT